ncbi:hypothetical protein [Mesorhizobium sp. BH1-1-4]|uniref:hypothetical protein n=1 Tax=Mesorhizobium sp. BH1-1-4 TaxID=2876662 RepID=UPI001CD17A4E|nr:hypothetical protein [Mesorhizobium sp. BH1-1-4]MBZ9996097.1 hypothetical protein [Mesorhizobium sp. BH1-1-4]
MNIKAFDFMHVVFPRPRSLLSDMHLTLRASIGEKKRPSIGSVSTPAASAATKFFPHAFIAWLSATIAGWRSWGLLLFPQVVKASRKA